MATVFVTGASRGIGLALARHYASRGDSVIAAARDPRTAGGLMKLASAQSGNGGVEPVELDVTDEAQLSQLTDKLAGRAIDIAICNAGIMSSRGGIEAPGHDAAEWQRVLMTNVAGVFLAARAVLPGLKLAKAGKLAVISSMMGSSRQATGDTLAYRVSKAAAANLGLNLAAGLKGKGIAVGIYHPGWVSSDMGGASAPVTPADSAAGLADRIDRLSLATTGVFEDYRGQPHPF
jgi:NAD(P)-dependent dehydrogenase (short-subunit alcohol dehydrogenase family)